MAQAPTASTVPFVATNPLAPHTSWSGNPVTLKGSMDSPLWGTDSFTYDWDPGDGGAHCTGAVSDKFTIGCAHTYAGATGETFTAVLKITDTSNSTTGPSPSVNCPPSITVGACYYTSLNAPPPNLPVEVNNAIDNGLWYLHMNMHRSTTAGVDYGDWNKCNGNNVDSCYIGYNSGPTGENCVTFENSGFLQTSPASPYQNDVRRCINSVFSYLTTSSIPNTKTNIIGTFNPDTNGNGIGVTVTEGNPLYQTGMMMDALVATGTPGQAVNANTTLANSISGGGITGSGPGGAYTYKDAVVDMVNYYSYCQNASGEWAAAGGWRYSCGDEDSDNSVAQWAAIGMIPARRVFGAPIPSEVLKGNQNWLGGSFTNLGTPGAPVGYFGYENANPIWGPYADTPSGMVQLAMNGLGRGTTLPALVKDDSTPVNNANAGVALFDSAESFMRDNFGNTGDATTAPKEYLYGLFSFTKSMLLHSNDGTGVTPTPIQFLQSNDDPGAFPPLDWYAAQTPSFGGSDPTDGVARWLVSIQQGDGSWTGHDYTSSQYYLNTAWAVTMLNKTVFQPVPVACATATPNPLANGGTVLLDGSCSNDQNPANQIVSWQWNTTGTGNTTFNIQPGNAACLVANCVKVKVPVSAPVGAPLPYTFAIRLRVTDNANPALTSDVVVNVVINSPPNPPTANAGGPYNFCPNTDSKGNFIYQPWYLNGTGSTNPDQGKTDGTAGAPPSTICVPAAGGTTGNSANACGFYWDLACSGAYNGPTGPQPNVTGDFGPATYGTNFNVCLKVVNNDNLAFPTATLASGLSSVASAQVHVHNTTDLECTHCVASLTPRAKAPAPGVPGNIQIYWTDTNSAAFPINHYNVYRSTHADFSSAVEIAGANSIYGLPAVQVPATNGATLFFQDNHVVGGTTYYYRVAPATANDTETCGSNVTTMVTLPKGR